MKKIAILSFINTKNYGGLLQAFALQFFLKSNGYDAFHVDYKAPSVTTGGALKRVIRNAYRRISFLFFDKKRQINEAKFRKKIALTHFCGTKHDLSGIECDYFIVGSDQVWNPFLNNFDDSYLLSFETAGIKLAFSASIGLSQKCPNSWIKKFKDNLPKFALVSVREKTAKDFLSKICDVNIKESLDPTFLLTKNEWLEATRDCDSSIIPVKQFALCYVMPGDSKLVRRMIKFARQIAKKECLQLYVIGLRDSERLKHNKHFIFGAGPSEFVNLIDKSSYVITNSFHGTVFSTIFNKRFFSFVSENGSSSALSERIMDLLHEFDLEDRLITEASDYRNKLSNATTTIIPFDKMEQKIKETEQTLLEGLNQ